MLIVLCWGYDHKAGNKININSFIGPYLKYFSRDKRIALAALGQYFLSREKYFYVRTDKRVNIIIVLLYSVLHYLLSTKRYMEY